MIDEKLNAKIIDPISMFVFKLKYSPIGCIFGYMLGTIDNGSLNIIYNLADFVNKILFDLIIWNVAVKESA